MTNIAGRTAFITGGANGIGLGIARAFARAGANVAIADIDDQALATAKAELSRMGRVAAVRLDVRDRDAYARVADQVETELGPVSLLFNNAGVAWGAPAVELTYEAWDWALGINLNGVINGVQTFLSRMVKAGNGGYIVNTASGAGLAATGAGVLYATAKFGVVGLSEELQRDIARHNIGVSVLCPGPVATDIVRRSYTERGDAGLNETQQQATEERINAMTAFLRTGTTIDEVGEMVLDAVINGRLYIHTDRMAIPFLEARNKALLEAMPPER
jgi:NAD(P)-dependent dehydrogenase (short-subunit alcohol dehydrogenase family)